MEATTRFMATGAMCSGAPGAWTPAVGVAGSNAKGIDVSTSTAAVPGNPLSR